MKQRDKTTFHKQSQYRLREINIYRDHRVCKTLEVKTAFYATILKFPKLDLEFYFLFISFNGNSGTQHLGVGH